TREQDDLTALRLVDKSAGAVDEMRRQGLGGPAVAGQGARRHDIGANFRVLGQAVSDPVAFIGVEPAVGKAGEIEEAFCLILDRLGRDAALPQRPIRGFDRRLAAGPAGLIIVYSGHAYSTTLTAKLSPQPMVSQTLTHCLGS